MIRTTVISAVSLFMAGALLKHFNPPPLQQQLDAIEAAVIEARGLAPPAERSLEFITREEYAARLESKRAEESSPEEAAQVYLFYRALDLAAPGLDFQALATQYYSSQIVGYYDSDSNSMTLILPSGDAPSARLKTQVKLTYAHEYGHALQDQHFDLEAYFEPARNADNFDLGLAMSALVEGDATNMKYSYLFELMERDALKTRHELESARSLAAPAPADVPQIIPQEQRFIYQQGNEFIWALIEAGNWDWTMVNRAYTDYPPQTSEHILHPERYLAGEEPIAVESPDHSALLDKGWRRVYNNAVGEFYLQQHLNTRLDESLAAAMAAGWGGDRIQIFVDDANDMIMWIWHQAWDSAKDAEEFAQGYPRFLNYRYEADGDNERCWVGGASAHCFARISDTETRISMAADKPTARALLVPGP